MLVSGTGSNMVALVRAARAGEVPARVVAVLADRPCPGLEAAAAEGLPTVVVEPRRWASRPEWDDALLRAARAHEPDLVVCAGFMRVLGAAFVDAFAGRLINLHPSLLPSFPGAHAVRDALAAGVTITGTTVHFVDHLVDHGPIVAQEEVRIEPGDTEASLHERVKEVERALLPRACRLVLGSAPARARAS